MNVAAKLCRAILLDVPYHLKMILVCTFKVRAKMIKLVRLFFCTPKLPFLIFMQFSIGLIIPPLISFIALPVHFAKKSLHPHRRNW